MLRKPIVAAVAVAVAIGVVAAGLAVSLRAGRHPSHGEASEAFSWLRPAPPPPDWNVARSTAGPLAYPPGWTPIKTDPGTASVALLGRAGAIDAFLNATPQQGKETLENWSHFRPAHNKGEGNEDVRLIASSTNLNFRSGPGSCVIDDYTTSKARYREIACLVHGPISSVVIVAAAPTALWDQHAVTLERAVSSVVA
jgi:hypothetical protein